MKLTLNRWISFLLAAVLLFSCVPIGAIPVQADDFPNTHVNTGNQLEDFVRVALTQEGYREASNGYTKYGDWYGSSRMEWCGAFISWCANQAGLPNSVIRKNGFAIASGFGLTSFTVNERMPKRGDLFFKGSDHTGIVVGIEGDCFLTVEGNTYTNGGTYGVYTRRRSLKDAVYNFATPKYQTGTSSHTHSYGSVVTEDEHPHKQYKRCSGCGDKETVSNKSTVDGCVQCQQDNCSHQYGNYKPVSGKSYHSATCSKCGKETTFGHTWIDDKIEKEATCKEAGSAIQKCMQCGTTQKVTIAKTNEHKYSDWLRKDSEKHEKTCQVCGDSQEQDHVEGQWVSDVFEHWYKCEICHDRGGNEVHSFDGTCESPCTVCDYVSTAGHVFYQWKRDPVYHWQKCENCDEIQNKKAHIYDNDCDNSCDECGYIREVTHQYEEQWQSNSTGHWHKCRLCGRAGEPQRHKLGPAATEQDGQACVTCGLEVVPALAHVHSFTYTHTADSHQGTCQCGYKNPNTIHSWNAATKKCNDCQRPVPVFRDDGRLWLFAIGGGALLLLLIISAIIIALVKRRMMRAAARAALRDMALEEALAEPETAAAVPAAAETPEPDETTDFAAAARYIAETEAAAAAADMAEPEIAEAELAEKVNPSTEAEM